MSRPRTWGEVKEDYRLHLLTAGRSRATISGYLYTLGVFERWCRVQGTAPEKAKRLQVHRWIAARLQEWKPATAYQSISALRSFYGWLTRQGRRDDPTAGLKLRAVHHSPHRPYTQAEFAALLAACDNDPCRAVRDRTILRLFAGGGIRVGELVAIKAEDIDRGRGLIRVHGKGAKERDVAPGPTAMAALAGCIDGQADSVFGIGVGAVEAMIHRREKEAGLGRVHPHGIRHTFAIRFLEKSRDLDALRLILGHETLAQAAEYAAYAAGQRALEQQRELDLGGDS